MAIDQSTLPADHRFLMLLGRTLDSEACYDAEIEGSIPDDLRGTLYRVGPGLFERAGISKHHLLDGDGMVHRFAIRDGGIAYSNRFVRTAKFVEEEKANAWIHPTWSARAPGGILANMGLSKMRSQAGITIRPAAGRLLASDEVGLPWEIDPESLATMGEANVCGTSGVLVRQGKLLLKAHSRIDGESGQWTQLGCTYGRTMSLQVIVCDKDGSVLAQRSHQMPRQVYFHDFLATARYVVVVLHPCMLSPPAFIAGISSFIDCLRWLPERGAVIAVIDKASDEPPLFIESAASYMWHGLNAYERGSELVVDWIGYTEPDHFIGPEPALSVLLQGRQGQARAPGILRRSVIDLRNGRATEEILASESMEFPAIDPRFSCRSYRYGYATTGIARTIFHDGLLRIDMESGQICSFRFGEKVHVGEPVFAAGDEEDAGWLLATGLDGWTGRSFLAIFDARNLAAGPVARAWLRHHMPATFHGSWVAQQ